MRAAAESKKTVSAPEYCPACQSASIVTTSKSVTCETYWRCNRCGEVWNPERRNKGIQRPRSVWQ